MKISLREWLRANVGPIAILLIMAIVYFTSPYWPDGIRQLVRSLSGYGDMTR